MGSLQDQLLKAGLIDQKKAKKATKEKRKNEKVQRKSKIKQTDESKVLAQQARAEKVDKDRQLNLEREKNLQQKAIAAQVKQLIAMNKLPKGQGEVPFNFSHHKKIKKLLVSEQISNQLTRGLLAIVFIDDDYEIIPRIVADKISQRDESHIVLRNDPASELEDEDDPYADYKIPDDLMW